MKRSMDEEGHSRGKGKISGTTWAGIGLIILGILAGAYVSPTIEPFVHPERAALVEQAQTIQVQNALLKQQVDCLVNGINQNHGKTTVSECT